MLVLGAGGRESAIAWACRRHGHHVQVAPSLPADLSGTDLVIVGPEQALAAGVADECAARGVPCFGPVATLARLETSKGHTRALAHQLGLPSPRFLRTASAAEAIEWWHDLGAPVVVKTDGLAGGKGVLVPTTPAETEIAITTTAAGGPFVVEERLRGPECSLMVLCSGRSAKPLPLAQDHKRVGEGDTGPNTGGMGAYAPAPVSYTAAELSECFVQPVLDHLADAGTPYIGVLYAGLMLTADGPRLLEFNCRFGDPEAQAVLPLLTGDLAAAAMAACTGRLDSVSLDWSSGSACTVVAAAAGYPDAPQLGATVIGLPGSDADHHPERAADDGDDGDDRGARTHTAVFLAGCDGERVTGGRVLAVTGVGDDLGQARARAYAGMSQISFPGMQVRRDIGWRASGAELASYAAAGVDIDEGARAVDAMKTAVERTHGPAVLHGLGSFGGAFSAAALRSMAEPVLVASTDGVGTKVELAARLGRHRGVGHDIVNHCVNDVLVQGARPLFFLDYIAASRIESAMVAEVVGGMAEACAAAGCALLGGETAEMPGVYSPGAFDIAGTLIGAVDRADLLPRPDLVPGDVLIGLASSGPHTNGYSLLRRLFEWLPMDVTPDGLDRPLGDALLEPHRSYLRPLEAALAGGQVKALAHITGGGLPENLPRVLPEHCDAVVHLGSWTVPPLFRLIREAASRLDTTELYRTVNMGIGMVVICSAADAEAVQRAIPEPTWAIGELVAGNRKVHLR